MQQIITSEKKPIKLWLDDIEPEALAQAQNLANLPFLFSHVAVMPDAHLGYGMPIGGVMATENVVIPNAVGVDIGCGMCAVKTSLHTIATTQLQEILQEIRKMVPVGFRHHLRRQDPALMPTPPPGLRLKELPVVSREYANAQTQLGTLGGGNHFIEIQKGSDDFIWLMLHSGSRNLGFKVANHYNRLAIDLNRRQGSAIPTKWQLAFLDIKSPSGRIYLAEMHYCIEFAHANRLLMMARIKEALSTVCPAVTFAETINIAHNYAALEKHFGKEVIVHRKGATRAQSGEIGIVPGSQGSPSYIVKGKGNPESFLSCAHGAGRLMGRKQAQRQLDLKYEQKRLEDQGIIHSLHHNKDLDEAAGAYKNIDQVLDNQQDLVEVLVELKPLAVIKG
ncbi:MAG: RtcB family protein [Deltaproteobacteria bacterium]|nr:RtcB family protein [Deltaproteobacteria bacterium]